LQADDETTEEELNSILDKDKQRFVTLIHQLIVCEDSYYGNKNDAY